MAATGVHLTHVGGGHLLEVSKWHHLSAPRWPPGGLTMAAKPVWQPPNPSCCHALAAKIVWHNQRHDCRQATTTVE